MMLWYAFGTNAAFRIQSGPGGMCVYVVTLNKSGYMRMHSWVCEAEIICKTSIQLI